MKQTDERITLTDVLRVVRSNGVRVFHWKGKMYRLGRGIVYRAHPLFCGIIMEGFWRRQRRRRRRKVSPSQSRFERRHVVDFFKEKPE